MPSRKSAKEPKPDAQPSGTEPVASVPDAEQALAVQFPIVGIGASAGGVEALTLLLRALPVDTGMAFVLVPHLSPHHASHLVEILARATTMRVSEVQGEPEVEPNQVYVIPPDRGMVMGPGTLQLQPRPELRGAHHPIDEFLQSLAQMAQYRAIGVIL